MNTSTRLYKGHPIAHRPISIPFHVGGHGPTPTTLYEVWNPSNPDRRVTLTPEEFNALTTAALPLAA